MIFLLKLKLNILTKKNSAQNGEFIISLDFSKNFTFHIQNAVQTHHWSNSQATLHPYMIYYCENDELKHLKYVIISGKLAHDTKTVHLFISKLVEY